MPIEHVLTNPELRRVWDLIKGNQNKESTQEPKALPDHEEPGEKTLLEPRKDDRTKETE